MNITIIGASAGVGLETVKRALDRNHSVTTLSRRLIDLPVNPKLKKLQGSATVKADLLRAVRQADAVIVALGTGMDRKPTTLYSDFAKLLVQVHQEVDLQVPCLVVTGFGAGESGAYNTWIMKLLFSMLLKDVYADKTIMEQTIAAFLPNWEIVRPGRLQDKPLTEVYRVETRLYKGINIGAIGRADVADFLVKQAENPTALKQYASISNK